MTHRKASSGARVDVEFVAGGELHTSQHGIEQSREGPSPLLVSRFYGKRIVCKAGVYRTDGLKYIGFVVGHTICCVPCGVMQTQLHRQTSGISVS